MWCGLGRWWQRDAPSSLHRPILIKSASEVSAHLVTHPHPCDRDICKFLYRTAAGNKYQRCLGI